MSRPAIIFTKKPNITSFNFFPFVCVKLETFLNHYKIFLIFENSQSYRFIYLLN